MTGRQLARVDNAASKAAAREILIWTTRDGREIALAEMTDDHVANALRSLKIWRSRVRRRDPQAATLGDLDTAIALFRHLLQQRQRAARRHLKADGTPRGVGLRRLGS